jgi:hypothetical protein
VLTERGATGGNLIAAGDLLLIATPERLFGFRQEGDPPSSGEPAIVAGGDDKVTPTTK